jgi:hypothetical protein
MPKIISFVALAIGLAVAVNKPLAATGAFGFGTSAPGTSAAR